LQQQDVEQHRCDLIELGLWPEKWQKVISV